MHLLRGSLRSYFCAKRAQGKLPLPAVLYGTRMKQWSEVRREFDVDGSLRDIYIENIDLSEWDVFITALKQSEYKFQFSHGELECDLPNSIAKIKALQEANPTILSIWLSDDIKINCHFFMGSEIELDVSPSDIQSLGSYAKLVKFLDWLSSTMSRVVKVTHEGAQEQVIFNVP